MDAFVKLRRNRHIGGENEEQESAERGQTSSSTAVKAAWPLYLSSDRLPLQAKGGRKEYATSCASSDDMPSTSSCDGGSSCSSPLSDSGASCPCDELDETIQRAELCSTSYREFGAFPQSEPVKASSAVQEPNAEVDATLKSPLFMVGSDVMAQVMSFLEAPEILSVMTMPLCKEWHQSYTSHQDLWRVLCLLEPFKANVGDDVDDDSSSEDSFCAFGFEPAVNDVFGQYRLMYTSFVRCMTYLTRIKDDTRDGRPPAVIDYGHGAFPHFGVSKSLKKFLGRSRGGLKTDGVATSGSNVSSAPIGVSDEGYSSDEGDRKRRAAQSNKEAKKRKFGKTSITDRLFGPTSSGEPSHLNLPKSCAIYSIVNWMVAYPDVEGIQTMCVEALPYLLEDEQQRLTAQRVGLVEIVIRSMLQFEGSLKLHTAAFHTMVLLARPLGGKEGMLFDNSMAESSTSLELMASSAALAARASASSLDRRSGSGLTGINGIAIMMESMRRFESEEKLQAMACWAMVNLALVPAQKTMLISLDGIQAMVNAMLRHPHDYDVQFRAMFALINLVVPCNNPKKLSPREGGSRYKTEKDVLDDLVKHIVHLVVLAMKNFCSSETILNRACLVLHNLSQSPEYLMTLLWTPHCYQMLEWCITNYPTDQVLRRSAVSTLHKLQVFLSENESLRVRFTQSIRSEQGLSLQNGSDENPNAYNI